MAEGEARPTFLQGSELLERAFDVAVAAHRGQLRKDGVSPYVSHPLAVAELLADAGFDETTVAAAILHDVVEDSELRLGDVVEAFGLEVGELVGALTDDRDVCGYEERKREHRRRVEDAGERTAAIYAADRLVNVRDMRALYGELGEAVAGRFNATVDVRVGLWREDLEMLERVVPRLALVSQLRAELDGFAAERPGVGDPVRG